MSEHRHRFRRREDRLLYSSRIVLPYVFVVLGTLLALHFVDSETKQRISDSKRQAGAVARESRDRSDENRRLIVQLQAARRQQKALNHRIMLVDARQNVLIEELQKKFPGEFRQPSLRVITTPTRRTLPPPTPNSRIQPPVQHHAPPHRQQPAPMTPPPPAPGTPPSATTPAQPPQQQPVIPHPTTCVLFVCV